MIKTIRKTALVGMLACSTLNAQAGEGLNDWSFGLNIGFDNSFVWGTENEKSGEKITLGGKKISTNFFNPWLNAGIHGSYAFLDWLGAGIELNYRKQGTQFTEEGSSDKKIKGSIFTHNLEVPVALCFYPMGRQEEEGILSLNLRWIPSFSMMRTVTTKGPNDNDTLDDFSDDFKEKIKSFDLGNLGLGLLYELPSGVILGFNYHIGFMNLFDKEKAKINNKSLKVEKDAILKGQHLDLRVGYNFAKLYY